jgi:ATP-dependent protease ClpP protease subunit
MAAIIHQYGKERFMVNRSLLMFHPAAGGLQGSVDQMRSRLGMIDRYVNKMDAYIAKRAGIPYDRFMVAILTEVWIDAEDSLALHFADKIVNVVEDQSQVKILPVLPAARAYKTFLDIKG